VREEARTLLGFRFPDKSAGIYSSVDVLPSLFVALLGEASERLKGVGIRSTFTNSTKKDD